MKRSITFILISCLLISISCKKDDASLQSCTTCNSSQTTPFEVCENNAGNATVNGEDTGTSFDVYIEDLVAAGVTCGG